MAFIVLGKCMVGKSRQEYKKINNVDKRIKTSLFGVHIVIYNTNDKDILYINQSLLSSKNGERALKELQGYTVNNEGKFVLDENAVGFKGQLINYTNETADNYWAIISINTDTVKLVDFNGDIKVVTTDNFNKLRMFNRIVNIWEKEDNTIDYKKYNKLDGVHQIVEISTDGMELPTEVVIENSLRSNNINIDLKEVGENKVDKQVVPKYTVDKYEIYNYMIENIQFLDVISIPNDTFKQLSVLVHKVLSSTFNTSGEYKEFKWIATTKLDSKNEESVIGVIQFDAKSEYVKLQAFSIYEKKHDITPNEIDLMYTKRKLEMKYI